MLRTATRNTCCCSLPIRPSVFTCRRRHLTWRNDCRHRSWSCTDLDIGMNDWMVPELEWDDSYVPDRGKVLSAEELEGMDKFYRYLDVDGDGIPYRTLPGVHPKGAYFTRGSGHTKLGAYTENSAEYQEVVDRLLVKWETARSLVPEAEIRYSKFNKAAILTLGSGDGACKEALDRLEKQNVGLNYCRVKAFPFTDASSRVHRAARSRLRGRAESGRPATYPADHGHRCRPEKARVPAALQRHADQCGLHR